MAKRRLLSLIYPVRCPVCRAVVRYDEGFCGKCAPELKRYGGSFEITGADGCFSVFEYSPMIKPAVMLMKQGVGGNAPFAFGCAVAELLTDRGVAGEINMIVPVPMHRSDVLARGFNQSELIAKEIGISLNIAVRSDIVFKQRETLPQKLLDSKQRKVNLLGAFGIADRSAVEGKRVLLVDDLCTTGSTLAEITALLKSCGASKVWCASGCKTPDRKELNDNDV